MEDDEINPFDIEDIQIYRTERNSSYYIPFGTRQNSALAFKFIKDKGMDATLKYVRRPLQEGNTSKETVNKG